MQVFLWFEADVWSVSSPKKRTSLWVAEKSGEFTVTVESVGFLEHNYSVHPMVIKSQVNLV